MWIYPLTHKFEREIAVWNGKRLPGLPKNAWAVISDADAVGNIVVYLVTARGKLIQFMEPESEFPSDVMIAQIMLCA